MFIRFAMCADPKKLASEGMWEQAKAALDVERAATSPLRQAIRSSVIRDIKIIESLPEKGLLPAFPNNYDGGSRTAISLSSNELNGLLRMWAKGFHKIVWSDALRAKAKIEIHHVTESAADSAFKEIDGHWMTLNGGPGVQVSFAGKREGDRRCTLYEFLIWDHFRFYSSVDEALSAADAA